MDFVLAELAESARAAIDGFQWWHVPIWIPLAFSAWWLGAKLGKKVARLADWLANWLTERLFKALGL